jgi:hypothetical protein
MRKEKDMADHCRSTIASTIHAYPTFSALGAKPGQIQQDLADAARQKDL